MKRILSWLLRYRIREFIRSSFWIAPTCALILAVFVTRLLRSVDQRYHWVCLDFTREGAGTILGAFVASMLTFIVVVASSLLLVVQLVSAGLTPRIIAQTFQHPTIRYCLSLFVFAYMMSITVLGRLSAGDVPQLTVAVTIGVNALSLILFLYFVGSVGMGLRPAQVMASTTAKARKVIFEIYPNAYDSADLGSEDAGATRNLGPTTAVVEYKGASGVLLAFDLPGLVALAKKYKAVIELVPRVGDYVAAGEPIFRIYGSDAIQIKALRHLMAVGPERTLEQDPRFAFRIIVDIASKALSPAINDPTTAVLALDCVHRLLRWVGRRRLLSGMQTDASGAVRLVFSTPSWDDFVWLATAEFRQYGGDTLRICQRLRAMLEHLIQTLPEPRRPALQKHLQLLNQTVDRNFCEPEDRERVRAGASQRNGASADA